MTNESRRDFIKKSAMIAAGMTILPSSVISGFGHLAPSDTFYIEGYHEQDWIRACKEIFRLKM